MLVHGCIGLTILLVALLQVLALTHILRPPAKLRYDAALWLILQIMKHREGHNYELNQRPS